MMELHTLKLASDTCTMKPIQLPTNTGGTLQASSLTGHMLATDIHWGRGSHFSFLLLPGCGHWQGYHAPLDGPVPTNTWATQVGLRLSKRERGKKRKRRRKKMKKKRGRKKTMVIMAWSWGEQRGELEGEKWRVDRVMYDILKEFLKKGLFFSCNHLPAYKIGSLTGPRPNLDRSLPCLLETCPGHLWVTLVLLDWFLPNSP